MFLHPHRRTLNILCIIVKSSSDTKHQSINFSLMCCHPLFLFWSSKPNPDKVWVSFINSLYNCLIFLFRHRSKRRTVHSSNLDSRIIARKFLIQQFQCFFFAAIKIMAIPFLCRDLKNLSH